MGKINGCAFICNTGGVIDSVLRDDFNNCDTDCKGSLFTSMLDRDSLEKALNMMQETKSKNIAFDYRLNILHENRTKSLYFMCVNLGEHLLVVGAENHKEAIEFTNHLHQINNEQSNQIRMLLKENTQLQRTQNVDTENLFSELSKVNNELVNLQRELNKKNSELKKLNDLKNRFMGIASHDLRNPLNVVQMFTEFLIEGTEDVLSEKHKGFLLNIKNSTQFMINLVEDLLEYSKIESGKIELNKEMFDVSTIIKNIKEFLAPVAQKKNIRIKLIGAENAHNIYADIFKMEQVINNLLNNAIKFSYQNTAIILKISQLNNRCYISITNTGIGIQKKNLEELFKPFQQFSFHGTGNEKGSGLGLFIVKQIIDNHKGKIWAESVPEKETTFYLEIPNE